MLTAERRFGWKCTHNRPIYRFPEAGIARFRQSQIPDDCEANVAIIAPPNCSTSNSLIMNSSFGADLADLAAKLTPAPEVAACYISGVAPRTMLNFAASSPIFDSLILANSTVTASRAVASRMDM